LVAGGGEPGEEFGVGDGVGGREPAAEVAEPVGERDGHRVALGGSGLSALLSRPGRRRVRVFRVSPDRARPADAVWFGVPCYRSSRLTSSIVRHRPPRCKTAWQFGHTGRRSATGSTTYSP